MNKDFAEMTLMDWANEYVAASDGLLMIARDIEHKVHEGKKTVPKDEAGSLMLRIAALKEQKRIAEQQMLGKLDSGTPQEIAQILTTLVRYAVISEDRMTGIKGH